MSGNQVVAGVFTMVEPLGDEGYVVIYTADGLDPLDCPSVGQEAAIANGRLFCAAPELYEALKALFASYKALADSGDAGFWSLEDQPEGKQALAALSRARGSHD